MSKKIKSGQCQKKYNPEKVSKKKPKWKKIHTKILIMQKMPGKNSAEQTNVRNKI